MTILDDHEASGSNFRHGVVFYAADADLVEIVEAFLAEGLSRGERCLVVALPAHRAALLGRLAAHGIDLAAARGSGHLVVRDALATLHKVSAGGRPHPAPFATTMESLLEGPGPVRIFGEMVSLLWQAGRLDDALALEAIWCQWLESTSARLLCAYPSALEEEEAEAAAVRAQHDQRIAPAETNHPAHRRPSRPCAARRFDPELTAVGRARLFVTESLRTLGHSEIADDVALVVTELAANAVFHAQTPFQVELASVGDGIEVAVCDHEVVLPALPDAECHEASGRGLQIVAALATRWGVERGRDAKVVWAEFPSSASAPPPSES